VSSWNVISRKLKWRCNVMNMMALLTYLQHNVTLNMPPTWCYNGTCGQTYLLTNKIVRGMHNASCQGKDVFSENISGKKTCFGENDFHCNMLSTPFLCETIVPGSGGRYLGNVWRHISTHLSDSETNIESISSFSQNVRCSMTKCVRCWFLTLERGLI